MSIQEEENYNIDIKKHVSIKKEQDKTNLSPLEVNRHDYNVITYSNNFSGENNIFSRNSENSVNYQQIIKKTMKEIKYNFMEEHKNILDTYYSIYSRRLDDIISNNFNSKIMEEYSNTRDELNQYQMNNQTDTTTRIINEIIDKNMDTFLQSIEFAQKFYSDVVQSYYNSIMNINKSSDR